MSDSLTDRKLLKKNIGLNLVGLIVPPLVAFFFIPILIDGLGKDRFGVLSLGWVVIGYFSLLDVGIGRAIVIFTSQALEKKRTSDIPEIFWSSLFLICCVGTIGAIAGIIASPILIYKTLKIPTPLLAETLRAFYILSFSIPVIILTIGLRGFLEALQRFDILTKIKIPMTISMFLIPVILLPFTKNMAIIFALMVLVRGVGLFIYYFVCRSVQPVLKESSIRISKKFLKKFISFGSWITVSNLISPLMYFLDKFFIAGMLSLTYVTYYSTAFEVSSKILLIPTALVGVLFPAFSATVLRQSDETVKLYEKSITHLFLVLFPIFLGVLLFAPLGLKLWLGEEFAQNSAFILQLLVLGVVINGLAFIPYSLIQAGGRPDIIAKLHMVELPVYIYLLFSLTEKYNILGTAIVWSGRVIVDAVLLFLFSLKFISNKKKVVANVSVALLIFGLLFFIRFLNDDLWFKVIFSVIALSGYFVLVFNDLVKPRLLRTS